MKFRNFFLFFLAPFLLFGLQCRKNKSPLEQLPPETQVGAGTFGCLINGNIFKPKGNPLNGPILSCAYQFVKGGYYFQLKANQENGPETLTIGLYTDSLEISMGQTIELSQKLSSGKAYGLHGHYDVYTGGILYYTDSMVSGELKIKYFDSINKVVSGTFWFDAFNSTNEKVEIRNGRFDMKFSL
jgi:hypothetical protein